MDVGYSPRKGMFELVDHLVTKHDVQRFSFAGATGIHPATQIKKRFFLEAIKTHNIDFDDRMYITSEMLLDSPLLELKKLFCKDKSHWPQAIISASDKQAKDILTVLKGMGARAPKDVIVTGSCGYEDSLFSEPPLTSIIEPTHELGWHAAERIAAVIENRPFKENLILQTSMIVRNSCGCNGFIDTSLNISSLPPLVSSSIHSDVFSLTSIKKSLKKESTLLL